MANPRGQQRDKPFLAALRLEIAELAENPKGLRAVAKKLIEKAAGGDVSAIKELADRLDGRVPQAITGEDGAALALGSINISALSDAQLAILIERLGLAVSVAAGAAGASSDSAEGREGTPTQERDGSVH
jgi:hypothetical protein